MAITSFVGAASPLTKAQFDDVVTRLGVDPPSLWALLTVETRSCGFFRDRRPQILFERHIFHKRTAGRYDGVAPAVSSAERGGYAGGAAEYGRLAQAMALDARAALESTSWGLGQVMGFHAVRLGYADAEDMVLRFCTGEDAQLDGIRRFVEKNDAIARAFRARDWTQIAFFYNGSAYAENGYDTKLERFYTFYTNHGLPDIDVRAAQVRLTFLGFEPHGIDGVMGGGTKAALLAFQQAKGIAATGALDQTTAAALEQALK